MARDARLTARRAASAVLASLLCVLAARVGGQEPPRVGGRLVIAQRSDPKTFNPLLATDGTSREIVQRLMGALVRLDGERQVSEPWLAQSCDVSRDGRRFTLRLRRGLRFSDGHPFDADDVLFTFAVHLDPALASPQRELLLAGGRPPLVRKLDPHTVRIELAAPHGPGQRLFDGLFVLPRHVLEAPFRAGRLRQTWGLDTPPEQVVGLGPFRLKQYRPGQHVLLERNPHYFRRDDFGRPLPYLDELLFIGLPSEDAQLLQFRGGGAQVLTRLSPENFDALARAPGPRAPRLLDLGASLEYTFLAFNLGAGGSGSEETRARRAWFADPRFRRAVSLAVDREGLARLVYRGRGTPLAGHVTPGNRVWRDSTLLPGRPDPARAARLLDEIGLRADVDGGRRDAAGRALRFSLLTSAGNPARARLAAVIQEDLRPLGVEVQIVTLEFRALIERVLTTRDFDAALLSLGAGDGDPGSEMNVWLSSGAMHVWDPSQVRPARAWEAEIDDLMRRQMGTADQAERKRLYDRVQRLVVEHLPIVPLLSPHALIAVDGRLGNLRPSVVEHPVLWNVDELYLRGEP